MTDEELIKRITDVAYDHGHDICYLAANRIEQLMAERDTIREAALREAVAVAAALAVKWWKEYKDRLSPHCADPQYQGMSDGADDVATAIEALIGENK